MRFAVAETRSRNPRISLRAPGMAGDFIGASPVARFCRSCGASKPISQSRRQGEAQVRRREAGLEGGSGVSRSKLLCSWQLERRELCERLEARSKAAGR